jgi:hypothetical protein
MSFTHTLSQYPPPLWLSHHPVWLFPYEQFDGIYADHTDCKYLSIGAAQFDESTLSAKTLRYIDRWSRQSEELPLHRLVDLTLWLTLTLFAPDAPANVRVAPGTFAGQDEHFVASYIPQSAEFAKREEAVTQFLGGKGQSGSHYELVRARLTKLKETLVNLGL